MSYDIFSGSCDRAHIQEFLPILKKATKFDMVLTQDAFAFITEANESSHWKLVTIGYTFHTQGDANVHARAMQTFLAEHKIDVSYSILTLTKGYSVLFQKQSPPLFTWTNLGFLVLATSLVFLALKVTNK